MTYDPDSLYTTTKVEDVELWLEDCESVVNVEVHSGGPGYTDWEKEFLSSIRDQFDAKVRATKRPLSGKQLATLKKMWDQI